MEIVHMKANGWTVRNFARLILNVHLTIKIQKKASIRLWHIIQHNHFILLLNFVMKTTTMQMLIPNTMHYVPTNQLENIYTFWTLVIFSLKSHTYPYSKKYLNIFTQKWMIIWMREKHDLTFLWLSWSILKVCTMASIVRQ